MVLGYHGCGFLDCLVLVIVLTFSESVRVNLILRGSSLPVPGSVWLAEAMDSHHPPVLQSTTASASLPDPPRVDVLWVLGELQ